MRDAGWERVVNILSLHGLTPTYEARAFARSPAQVIAEPEDIAYCYLSGIRRRPLCQHE